MNIKHYLSAAAALALFAACSDYDPGMSENAIDLTDAEIETIEEYSANFIKRYGTPAANHTWGFGAKGSEDEVMETRSTDNPNSNMWVTIHKDGENLTGMTYEAVDGSVPPGFPDRYGKYHIWTDGGASHDYSKEVALNYDELQQYVKNHDEVHPSGDVTDEEILYVSAWFRNNRYPISEPLNSDKFYAQAISKDYDRTFYASETGLNNQGHNNWSEGTVGAYAKRIPLNWYKNGEYSTTDPNEKTYNDTREENYSLDQLGVKADNDADYVHIYNKNAGNTSSISETNPTAINTETWSAVGQGISSTVSYRAMMYMNNTATKDFRAWNSGDPQWEFRWVLKHLTFTGRDNKEYDGWYLAFDTKYRKKVTQQNVWNEEKQSYDHFEQWEEKDYDGYYSNYIVKIVPGEGFTQHNWHRVMCEDLGSTDDYDFNDLVYDVYFTGTVDEGYTAHIVVQASGGTLPIYVASYSENNEFEAHHILQNGNPKMTANSLYKYEPVNVAAGVKTNPSQEILFEMKDAKGDWYKDERGTDPDYIPILVTSLDGERKEAARGKTTFILLGQHNNLEKGLAPQKICIPGNQVRWMRERKQIETSYKNFDGWVTGGQNSEYDFGQSKDWTIYNVDSGNLY